MPPPPSLLSRLTSAASAAARGFLTPRAEDPFGGRPYDQGPAKIPDPAVTSDQPMAPPPGGVTFEPGYHDHTFVTAVPTPISYGGITLDLARSYLEQHDAGVNFYGSAVLAVAMTRFPEVYSALGVRCAPSIALPRQILGGSRGLGRIVREETEAAICPPQFRPSPYFPPVLWGSIQIDLAMQGFFVLQHVYGKPNARGVRRMWTRRWPTWAVWYNAYRKTYIALTTEGPVDILNDGKFTLGGKSDIPHLQGALRPLIMPVFDGSQVVQARAGWIDKYSDPKWIGTLPDGQGPRTPEGKAFFEAMKSMQAPGGVGAFPHGSDVKIEGLSAEASACFKEALDSDVTFVDKVLTGLDTSAGGGVYKPVAFWGILHSTVGDDIAATVRSVNVAIEHETEFNYGDSLAPKDRPALSIPLPDPEADARYDAKAKRQKAYSDQLTADRAAGIIVDKDRNEEIATELGAVAGRLAETTPTGAQSFGYDQDNGVITIGMRLDELGKPIDDPTRAAMTVPEYKAHLAAKQAEAEAAAQSKTAGAAPPEGVPAKPAAPSPLSP